MEFKPTIAKDMKLMDARLFKDEIMGLKKIKEIQKGALVAPFSIFLPIFPYYYS